MPIGVGHHHEKLPGGCPERCIIPPSPSAVEPGRFPEQTHRIRGPQTPEWSICHCPAPCSCWRWAATTQRRGASRLQAAVRRPSPRRRPWRGKPRRIRTGARTTRRGSRLAGATGRRHACRAMPAGLPVAIVAVQLRRPCLLNRNRGLPLSRPFDRGDWNFAAGHLPRIATAIAADEVGLLPLSGRQGPPRTPGGARRLPHQLRRKPAQTRAAVLRHPPPASGAMRARRRPAISMVGPLARDEVDAVFADDTPQVPLLALNRGSRTPPAGSAGFSLSPEDEASASPST